MSGFRFFELDINTLVQVGDPVKIKNLRSEEGQRINGKKGVVTGVQQFDYFTHVENRWAVKFERDAGEFSTVAIRTQNLEWDGDRGKLREMFLVEMKDSEGCPVEAGGSVYVGKDQHGKRTLAIYRHKTKSMEDMKEHINAQFLDMGVPSYMWVGGEAQFEQTIEGAIQKRSGKQFFASLGGGITKGPIQELGITLTGAGGECANCAKAGATNICSSCHVGYCSANCQKEHWGVHKVACKSLRDEKVKIAWKQYDDEFLKIERPDGKPKPLWRNEGGGKRVAWEMIKEARVFFNGGDDGPVDTGLVIRYRLKDSKSAAVAFGSGALDGVYSLEEAKEKMIGSLFYEQPFLLPEFFKLKTRGQLLGQKEVLTKKKFLRSLEKCAGRKCNYKTKLISKEESSGMHLFEGAYISFSDVICDDFFIETYFDNQYLL
mmetsp:Transcript_30753/g.52576  ORF Transcript_30753/g.52576 Transcript_30753/m.52576 type:complete len:432 (-) Transcript_30753:164-1459(-)